MGVVESMLHSKSLTMVTSLNNSNNEGRTGKPRMENGDCNVLAQPIYKRRKVSAIRDYPAGCGRLMTRIDLMPNVDTAKGTIVEDESGKDAKDEFVRTSKLEDEPQNSEFLNCSFSTDTIGQTNEYSVKKEISMVSPNHVDEAPLTNEEPVKMHLVGLEDLEKTELTRTAEPVKCDSSSMSKDLLKMGPSSPEGEVVLSSSSKFLSLDANIAGSNDCLEKAITRRHSRQRRVSAIRDFPPLCGRNAPCLNKDECLEGVSFLDNMRMGQQDLAVDDKAFKKAVISDVKEVKKIVKYGDAGNSGLVDIFQGDFKENAGQEVKKSDESRPSSEIKFPPKDTRDQCVALSDESNHRQVVINSSSLVKEESSGAVQFEGTSGKEIVVYSGVQSREMKPLGISGTHRKLKGGFNGLQTSSDRITVLGLMSESECPWRNGKGSSKFTMIDDTNERKGKKVDFFPWLDRSKAAIKTKDSPNYSRKKPLKKKKGNCASEGMGQLVIWEEKNPLDHNKNMEELCVFPISYGHVIVPPLGHGNPSGHYNDSSVTRNKVRETLRLFQAVSRKLLQEEEAKLKDRANPYRRIDLQAAKILKEKGKYVNTGKQILGLVPGVEVGDEFQYRVELNIIGLHRQIQGGIDYVLHNGKILATSVVASGGYADELDNSDVLIYTGQGGNVIKNDKEPEDQKLERGNLALRNSFDEKNPVRVIRGSESMDGKFKRYVYDGLYEVETHWQDMGPHGKLVFKFRLRRIPGQPELAWKEVKECKKFKRREGLCVEDISSGKEPIPICAVNTIDDKKPPPFEYTTRMIYPNWCNPIPPEGCSCNNGCSDSEKCSCAVKNGGEIPYNHNGAIVEAKPLVYECGASCRCSSTCHNRVSQHGIKFQLEIFKTKTRGWGVRSLNSIPSGSFICEYIGELLEEKEAEQRTGNDEYLFDIGNNYTNTLWDGLSSLMPDAQSSSCEIVGNGGFTIDAAQYGNVGRFINHSCSPNLYAQNVLYDHDDKRIPHIMLFAAENIPPLQELSYDYNYMIDQVRDSDGNIKKKDCFCGSVECTGRMY